MIRFRPTVVEVDLDAVRHNVRILKPPAAELMAVVKANAYGHGDVPVARAALEAGATWLGVALVEEGLRLREAGVDAPILVLSEFPRGSEKDAVVARLTPAVYTDEGIRAVADASAVLGRPVAVHVKVDTGMHRAGVYPPEAAVDLVRRAVDSGLAFEGLWTHFARAGQDAGMTLKQLRRFFEVADALRPEGLVPRYLHAANSSAVLRHPEAHLSLVRTGIAIYGLDPASRAIAGVGLRPALSWRSAVTIVRRLPAGEPVSYGRRFRLRRESTVATVPVGFADGYHRVLSSRAEVLIRGRRYRVAGTVTMDQIMVDCRDDDVQVGDEVVLIGRQDDEEVSAKELAGLAGTISYEIVTSIGERVPREYLG